MLSTKDSTPLPELPPVKSYQREDALRGLKLRNVFFGHEPGLGKTRIAIEGARMLGWEGFKPPVRLQSILVISPTGLRGLWKWYFDAINLPCITIETGADAPKIREAPGGAVVCSYDLTSMIGVLRYLASRRWDLIIYDEAHYLSNPAADRTCACLKNLFPLASYNWFLSGTPIKDKPENIWAIANAINPARFPTLKAFYEEFCTVMGDDQGRNVVRPGTVEQLKKLGKELKSTFLIRRSKAEVAPELAEKEIEVVPLICEELNTDLAARDFLPEAEKMLLDGKAPRENTPIATQAKQFGIWKVPLIAEYIHMKFDGALESCVLFVWHKEVLATLKTFLRRFRVVTVQGGDSKKSRDFATETFQDGRAQIFLCTYAAAEGITLPRSDHVIIGEMSWALDQNKQAIDRIHRLGQTKTCFIKYLLMQNSFDNLVYKTYKQKGRAVNHILGAS